MRRRRPFKWLQMLAGSVVFVAMSAGAQLGNFSFPAPAVAPPGALPGGPAAPSLSPGAPQPSPWTASVILLETVTDNVNLVPSNAADGGAVTEITPSLGINHHANRTNLVGTIQLPVVIYAPSGVASDRVYPSVNLLGDVALVKNLLFVEGAVNITQQFFSPFGAQPASLTNPSQNRYRSDLYRVSPYIKGVTQANTNYELRNDNVWTNLSGAPINANNSYYTTWTGTASNVQTTLGWQASFNYTDVNFNNQRPVTTQVYRISPMYNVNPHLRLLATGGYEENRGAVTSSNDAIYGVGFAWHPSATTNITGDWEQRFFGSSYRFAFDHSTPLSAWSVRVSRAITTYPQQIATVPGNVNIASFLNNLFVLRIPDPAERQAAIDQFIRDRGLPTSLANPLSLYSEQILLAQSASASATLIGARNTVFTTIYYVKSQPISASGVVLPPLLSTGNDNTQTGAAIVWTHQVTPSIVMLASVDGSQTEENASSNARTRQGLARLVLSRPLTPATTAFVGARYQTLQSNVAPDYTEVAAFVGLNYTFR